MPPIPSSDLPGHKQLHQRVIAALETCRELQSVDFKESETWLSLKWRIITTAMGMGNLRDGGVIIVGVSESGDSWDLTGINEAHLATFDPDDVTDGINKYVSPPMSPDIVAVQHGAKTFLAIQFEEFSRTPFVCKKNSPDDIRRPFKESYVFIRPPGKPQTKRVLNAAEMDDLLSLAAEKRARQLLQSVKRLGLSPSDTATLGFESELQETGTSSVAVSPEDIRAHPHWQVVYRPEEYDAERIATLSECRNIVMRNRVALRGWDFPHVGTSANPDLHGGLSGNNWIGGWSNFMSHLEYWRFYQSSQFLHLSTVRESREPQWHSKLKEIAQSHHTHIKTIDWDAIPGFLEMLNFVYCITEFIEFAARLSQAGVYEGAATCSIALSGVEGYMLVPPWDRQWWEPCYNTQALAHDWRFPVDTLVGGSDSAALEVCCWFFERLGWDNPNRDVIHRDIVEFLNGKART